MSSDYSFIGRIYVDESDGLEFRGTGFLVAPNYVVTCAHVLVDTDCDFDIDAFDEDATSSCQSKVEVVFGDLKTHSGIVAGCAEPDLALIRLETPAPQAPIPFLSGIQDYHESAITELGAQVAGFSGVDPATLVVRRISQRLAAAWQYDSRELRELQVAGGLLRGMSGSPLLIEISNRAACAGIAYLGGETAASSRLILSDVILRFLSQHDVHPYHLDAAQHLPSSLGKLTRKWRMRRGLSRRQLASDLGVTDFVLAEWENDKSIPLADHRNSLYELLIRGDWQAVEEWAPAAAAAGGNAAPWDAVAWMRPLATPGALVIVTDGAYQSIGREPTPIRPRFAIGSSVRILVDLPWPANMTFFDVEKMESFSRQYYRLDAILRYSNPLGPGRHEFPPDGRALPVGDPPGQHCLAVLAQRCADAHSHAHLPRFTGISPAPISCDEALEQVQRLSELDPQHRLVALCDYEVVER